MGVIKDIGEGIGNLLTGGAISRKKDKKKAKKFAREAREEASDLERQERTRRRNIQRASLQAQPSLFDMLGGPDA